MLKRNTMVVLLGVLVLALASVVPVLAGDNWYVYLYNGMNQELVRVNFLDGTQEAFSLDSVGDAYIPGSTMGFSQDGNRIAVCAGQPTENGQGLSHTVVAWDLASGSNQTIADLGQTIGCHIGANGLNADGSLMAVGVVNYFPTDVNDAGSGKPMWQLLVLDAVDGEVVAELNADTPLSATTDLLMGTPLMLQVQEFVGDEITFAAVPWGVGGPFRADVYTWNMATGSLELLPNDHRGNLSLMDALPATGETVWLDYDPSLPAVDIEGGGGPMGLFNVVKIADKTGQERVIFHSSDALLGTPRFIDGGSQLAILLHRPVEPNMPFETTWIALDREGNVSELLADVDFGDIVDAPGGYAFFQRDMDAATGLSTFKLEQHLSTDQETAVLWSANDEGWELLWTSPTPLGGNLTPFPTVAP